MQITLILNDARQRMVNLHSVSLEDASFFSRNNITVSLIENESGSFDAYAKHTNFTTSIPDHGHPANLVMQRLRERCQEKLTIEPTH